jgi:hypothetical protein
MKRFTFGILPQVLRDILAPPDALSLPNSPGKRVCKRDTPAASSIEWNRLYRALRNQPGLAIGLAEFLEPWYVYADRRANEAAAPTRRAVARRYVVLTIIVVALGSAGTVLTNAAR